MPHHRFALVLLGLIAALGVFGFWWLDQTTAARIASLVFLLAVGCYAFIASRPDVLAATGIFFGLLDSNRYLTDHVLPIWLGVIGLVALSFTIWFLLFHRQGWHLVLIALIVSIEILLLTQYINIESKLQALLITLPVILAMQYYYFRLLEVQYGQTAKLTAFG